MVGMGYAIDKVSRDKPEPIDKAYVKRLLSGDYQTSGRHGISGYAPQAGLVGRSAVHKPGIAMRPVDYRNIRAG